MRLLTAASLLPAINWPAEPQPRLKLVIDEYFASGTTSGVLLQDRGEFTREGWKVTTPRCQIRWDLGKFYSRGQVEVVLRGPLRVTGQDEKRIAVALWNEEAGADGDRKTQGFYQLRFQEDGMMLRLTFRPGGRSYEGRTGPLDWDESRWYAIRGTWDTTGGENRLSRDGKQIQQGKFNSTFPGFRWVFIGKDNYQQFHSIPGVIYRSLKVWVEE